MKPYGERWDLYINYTELTPPPGELIGLKNDVDKSIICHECGKNKNCNLPLAKCQSASCSQKFWYQCIRKYQIDSFIKADFKHLIENPKICPVCAKQCKCQAWGFRQEEDTVKDNVGIRKRSLRIREAK